MMAQTRIVARFTLLFLLLGSPALEAQPDTNVVAAPAMPRRAVCWQARPQARCGSYVVTELAVERAVLSSTDAYGNSFAGTRFVGTFGPMINRGPRQAWGLLVSMSTDDPDALDPLRVEGRYRKWLGPRSGFDFALGLTRNQGYFYSDGTYGTERQIQLHGLTAAVGIEQGFFGLDARVDLLRAGESRSGPFSWECGRAVMRARSLLPRWSSASWGCSCWLTPAADPLCPARMPFREKMP